MTIIVEGPDGAGKTSLINRLHHVFPEVEHGPRACTSEGGPIEDLMGWIDTDVMSDYTHKVIYDRHPLISEPIYGPAIRGSSKLSDFHWLNTRMSFFLRRNPLIIFCLPPWEEVKANVEKNHEPNTPHLRGVLRYSQAIYDMYVARAALNPAISQTWVWDYTSGDFSKLCQAVRSHIGH